MPVVKIYSTPTCPYCAMAKRFFEENGVRYIDVDVSRDEAAAREMIAKSGQMGVPVIEIDGQIIIGFDVPAIRRALGLG
ncbi:MAG: glutaredoxin domain-containing protein [Candidatus Micrarchaeia archaeon]